MASKRGAEPRIVPSADCGNSPKNTLLQDIAIAFAKRDAEFLLGRVTDDIRWEVVGGRVVEGREAFARALQTLGSVTQLTIDHVMSHGRVGAVNGLATHRDGAREFCDVYEFANAKAERIKSIKSYVIEQGDARRR
jgi:hypothetical protein